MAQCQALRGQEKTRSGSANGSCGTTSYTVSRMLRRSCAILPGASGPTPASRRLFIVSQLGRLTHAIHVKPNAEIYSFRVASKLCQWRVKPLLLSGVEDAGMVMLAKSVTHGLLAGPIYRLLLARGSSECPYPLAIGPHSLSSCICHAWPRTANRNRRVKSLRCPDVLFRLRSKRHNVSPYLL
jgi:hypothetical protein